MGWTDVSKDGSNVDVCSTHEGSKERCIAHNALQWLDERGRSSVWLEHSTVTREVAGSSPVAPVGVRELEYLGRSTWVGVPGLEYVGWST